MKQPEPGADAGLRGPGRFAAPAEHYDRFMGRYVPGLAASLADAAGVMSGQRVLDVGCGPGGLTRELGARVGAESVAAIDPAPQFAAACRERNPGADVRDRAASVGRWTFRCHGVLAGYRLHARPRPGGARDGPCHPPARHSGRVHVGYRRRRDDDAANFLDRRPSSGWHRRGRAANGWHHPRRHRAALQARRSGERGRRRAGCPRGIPRVRGFLGAVHVGGRTSRALPALAAGRPAGARP
ncbi:MAG: class I SAM-dependent methyltransferase [Solirubrobacterales bacterium]|nr:class I SAM-dependent methyltransferase [Solirubrobacterales bacterium]MBV9944524.1 class I SAM-dependent methyltransferase [Solirubrobacterales bacterium]